MRNKLTKMATTMSEQLFVRGISINIKKNPRDMEARLVQYNIMIDSAHRLMLSGRISKEFYATASMFVSMLADTVVSLR